MSTTIPTPLEIIINEFIAYKDKEIKKKKQKKLKKNKETSSETYGQMTNAFKRTDVFKTKTEQNFLSLLPKLLVDLNRKKDILKLIGLIQYSNCMNDWGTNLKSYKTYISSFLDFLEKRVTSKANKSVQFINEIEQSTPGKLDDDDKEQLEKDLSDHIIFLHKQLHTKFKSRLRRQDRVSGDKVWLPLGYIAKIFKQCNDDGFTNWLNCLVDDVYIHYYDDNDAKIKSVAFKQNDIFLHFKKNGDLYDVYLIMKRSGNEYRVYTPTGEGNKKEEMRVKNISEIDIDHVKSIDTTLRDLDDSLHQLKMVTKSYRDMLDDISEGEDSELTKKEIQNIEKNAIQSLIDDKEFKIKHLKRELTLIRNDGVLRLMDSAYNEKKSNGNMYKRILIINDEEKQQELDLQGKYIGIIGTAIINKKNKLYIYQDLNENGITRATDIDLSTSGDDVPISKDLINYL